MTPQEFETWFNAKLLASMTDFVGEVKDDVQASIANPCPQYATGHGGHSHAGNPPFAETRTLYNSITSNATMSGNDVTGSVTATAPYSASVEARRPYMAPGAQRAAGAIAGRLSAGLASRLP